MDVYSLMSGVGYLAFGIQPNHTAEYSFNISTFINTMGVFGFDHESHMEMNNCACMS